MDWGSSDKDDNAEIAFDYHLTTNKPVPAFAGIAIAYSNPSTKN